VVSWAQWVGKAGSCELILQEHFSLRACMSSGPRARRVSRLFINCEIKGQNSVCINSRAAGKGIKGSLTLPLAVLIYIPRAGNAHRACVVLFYSAAYSSRRLTKCAQRDLQRRGVFLKLVFYTFPYFARHYGKSRAKKTRATRFSCNRSSSPVLGANFPYYHLFWACKLCLKCRTAAACSALVARFRLLFIHLLNPDRYPQWGNSLMNIDFDG